MFAIIRSGNQQFKVSVGDKIFVQKLTHEVGEEFVSKEVLLLSNQDKTSVGSPLVEGASYRAAIRRQFKDDKVIVFKKKRRKNYRRKKGHRQNLTEIEILALQ